MRRVYKRGFIIIIVGLLLISMITQMIKLRERYPETETVYIESGQEGFLTKYVKMQVQGCRVLDQKEFVKLYGENADVNIQEETKIYIVKVLIRNSSDNIEHLYIYDMYLEKLGYANGIIRDTFFQLNPYLDMELELKAKESVELEIPYLVYAFQFRRNDWETLGEESFYLVSAHYPVKRCWGID